MLGPVYDLMDELLKDGALSGQSFSVDPRPPSTPPSRRNPLQKLLFKIMYSKQDDYEAQLRSMGLLDNDAFTCTCYQPEVGNRPRRGDILSWAESSAVVFANSVLGARCNRNSGIIEMFGSIAGFVPEFGLLTNEPQGDLDHRSRLQAQARSASAWQRHWHEGDGRRPLHLKYRSLASQRTRTRHAGLP